MSNAYINQKCFHTYQFVVTRPIGGGNYVGYIGYKRCDPLLKNSIVEIYADGGLVVSKTAPDFDTDFYGEEFSLGRTASRVRFVVKGIDALDRVIFCIGGYWVTVSVVLIALILILLLT